MKVKDTYSSCPRCAYMTTLFKQLVILVSTFLLILQVWLQGWRAKPHLLRGFRWQRTFWRCDATQLRSVVRPRAGILAQLSNRAVLSVFGIQIVTTPSWDVEMGQIQSKPTLETGQVEPKHRVTQEQNVEPEQWVGREDRAVLLNSDQNLFL